MTDEKMIESLWSLGNGITGFAVLQALTFLYSLGNHEFRDATIHPTAKPLIIGLTCAFTLTYLAAIVACWRLADRFSHQHKVEWRWVTIGRIAIILFFNGVALGIYAVVARHG
jgi:hypothetical protein